MASYTSTTNYTTWTHNSQSSSFSSSSSLVNNNINIKSNTISMSKTPTTTITIKTFTSTDTHPQSTLLNFPKYPSEPPQITPLHHPPQPQQPPPQWNFLQRAAAKALDILEGALISREFNLHPLPKTSDPRVQLSGNFAPVPEQPVHHHLPVSGTIPDCTNGVYLRNGANPLLKPNAGHHLFDGDGMIHAVKMNGNSVSYSCRFTETNRLVQERKLGHPAFPKAIGELHGHSGIARLALFYARGLFGLIDHNNGIGVANAGLVYFNRRLLAMSEDDLPYQVTISPTGDLSTTGRYDFNGQLRSAMIAHPKLDPVTGEMFALSYDVVKKPYLKYFKFSKDGKKSDDVEIPLAGPTMIHDFAITENYVVIPDQQVVFKLGEMINGGSPVMYDEKKMSRFGILSKNAKTADDIIWVDSPDTFCFHLWNAWEEPDSPDEVVVIGSCMTPPDSIFNESDIDMKSVLSEIRLNIKTGKSTQRPIINVNNNDSNNNHVNLEAGMVNRNLLGRKTRYTYLAITEPWPKVSGFAKVDLSSGEVEKFMYGDNRYGGEPFFLPKDDESSLEDDGYVMAFVHDEEKWESEFLIVNVKSMRLEASIKLPSRVPYGFHGTFVSLKELGEQV